MAISKSLSPKLLFLVLRAEPYIDILCGEKHIEYCEASAYWRTRLTGKKFESVIFQLGYNKPNGQMQCDIKKIKLVKDLFNIYLDLDTLQEIVPLHDRFVEAFELNRPQSKTLSRDLV